MRHAVVRLPSAETPMTDPKTGRIASAWYSFFAMMGAEAPTFEPVTLGPSPFSYQASAPGSLIVRGGTVSAITLTRQRDTITITGVIAVPMSLGDIAKITYTVAPTVTFVPLGAPM